MNILYLYNASQTHTNTVFDHLSALGSFSCHRAFFANANDYTDGGVELSRFDAVCVHYSIRLPYDEISLSILKALQKFNGLKFLFIQDEYDYTYKTWSWIKNIGFQLVFTSVPEPSIQKVYPVSEFPNTRFISNLTGYVPLALFSRDSGLKTSMRSCVIGYRGRSLPPRYGLLGFEKVDVGRLVRQYCDHQRISNNIAWNEEARIYGPAWDDFLLSCRAMLGSESGSNVFDWDGQLQSSIDTFKLHHPKASDYEIYQKIVRHREIDGLMNQVSPRVFEAIAARTVLVLFEGEYSGVIKADEHFIPLKKDGSNLAEVFEKLNNNDYVDQMAERAYFDVIEKGKYSYQTFVGMVDGEISNLLNGTKRRNEPHTNGIPMWITTSPIRTVIMSPSLMPDMNLEKGILKINFIPLWLKWQQMPWLVRYIGRPISKGVMRVIKFRG
jgi:hypothetical protein